MAVAGRKPKPVALKVVQGNPGRRPLPEATTDVLMRESPLEPPKKLTKAQRVLWDRFINTAWWLSDHDVPMAYMWVCLQSEHDKAPKDMIAARIAQLRALGSELGLARAARDRLGITGGKKQDPADKFFD